MGFSKRLIDLREESGMRQKDLADKLNLKPNAISKYEHDQNQPSIQTLVAMAEIFGCSVDYLLGLSSVKNPYTTEHFTPKEVEIVARYRMLSKENQIRVDERIGAMLDGQRE